jgi:hypothetical protein
MNTPQLAKSATPAEIRLMLAGLVDPNETLAPEWEAEQKKKAIEFVACLPEVFGPTLDRMTLWDRIGTALETAHAKTVGVDHEFFVSRVLDHIKAESSQVARCTTIQFILHWLDGCSEEARQAWLSYMATHRYAVLVHAKTKWEQTKQDRKEGKNNDE